MWRPWNDLPQELLCLIFQSKSLLLPDRVRFRAVCKTWCLPKDEIIIKKSPSSSSSLEYPWLFIRLGYLVDSTNYSFMYNLVQSHYNKANKISIPIKKLSYKIPLRHPLHTTYATKCGWMLLGNIQKGGVLSLFFLNPFSNHHIQLPPVSVPCDFPDVAATFTAIPTCLDYSCEVLVLFCTHKTNTYNIARYKYNRKDDEDSWTTQLLEYQGQRSRFPVHYMDGKLYCFFDSLGVLKSYSLADKTWELVSSNPPLSTESSSIHDCSIWLSRMKSCIWLTQIRSSLVMVVGLVSGPGHNNEGEIFERIEWMIFKFDSSRKRWIDLGKDFGSFAFFVCGETILSLPIEDEDEDCLIFHRHNTIWCEYRNNISCYSLKQKRIIPQPQEPYLSLDSHWNVSFSFVEPPFLV